MPTRHVDFTRRLVCILGLPFDVITLDAAVERIRSDAMAHRRCFVSTPNLDFAVGAFTDPAFRGSVLRSDLCLVDGMPLVWIARLLNLPVQERVSGANLFEALEAHAGPPITVFLVGGPPSAASSASERINRRGGGIRCVGFDDAGFGSLDDMSSPELIQRINASAAQFVVVALGAKKGQAWIEKNADRLTAPVLCHLGAVVNFAAGTLERAPAWMQRAGLEWFWRIKEEPQLWRRYRDDGLAAARWLCTRVVSDAVRSRRTGSSYADVGRVEQVRSGQRLVLQLSGGWNDDSSDLRAALARAVSDGVSLTVDVSEVTHAGNTFVALLLIAKGYFEAHGGFAVTGASRSLRADFRRRLAESLLTGN